jgi:plastocyanin
MARRVQFWVIAGALTFAALGPASAQGMVPPGLRGLANYTGVLTSFGSQSPRLPSQWIIPQFVIYYQAPSPVLLPEPAPRPAPAVEPVPVTMISLRSDAAPQDVRVKPGAVVTWRNAEERERTLIVHRPGQARSSDPAVRRSWRIGENGSFSLAFYQPGVYEYSLQEEPERRGRIVVAE